MSGGKTRKQNIARVNFIQYLFIVFDRTKGKMEEQNPAHDTAYLQALIDKGLQNYRVEVCKQLSQKMEDIGSTLWAFGLIREPSRRALAIVVQMGSALTKGTIQNLESDNRYAAAALLRQFVEIEYLLYLFAINPEDAEMWLLGDHEKLRKWFSPAEMRRRSKGFFRADEYWSHCEIGGHPHPKSMFLLPNIEPMKKKDPMFDAPNFLWVDLGQHIRRALSSMIKNSKVFAEIPSAISNLNTASNLITAWLESDPCAPRR